MNAQEKTSLLLKTYYYDEKHFIKKCVCSDAGSPQRSRLPSCKGYGVLIASPLQKARSGSKLVSLANLKGLGRSTFAECCGHAQSLQPWNPRAQSRRTTSQGATTESPEYAASVGLQWEVVLFLNTLGSCLICRLFVGWKEAAINFQVWFPSGRVCTSTWT